MAAVQRLAAGHAELDLGLAGVAGCGPYAAVRTGEVHAIALDSKEAGEELGWKPSVDIVEGICSEPSSGYARPWIGAGRSGRCVKGFTRRISATPHSLSRS